MKFLKDNWYKLMTGTAMLIFACGFFIYAVSPSYANQTGKDKTNKEKSSFSKGVVHYNHAYFVDDGYVYKIYLDDLGDGGYADIDNWRIAKIN